MKPRSKKEDAPGCPNCGEPVDDAMVDAVITEVTRRLFIEVGRDRHTLGGIQPCEPWPTAPEPPPATQFMRRAAAEIERLVEEDESLRAQLAVARQQCAEMQEDLRKAYAVLGRMVERRTRERRKENEHKV